PRPRAQRLLHALAPYLRRPGITYGTFAFLWLVLLLWQPTVQFGRTYTVVGLLVLSAVGMEAIRRIAERRYPDAQPVAIGVWLSDTWATFTERDQRADLSQLATLAELHEAGKLTDEEFATAKQKVLA